MFRSRRLRRKAVGGLRRRRPCGTRTSHLRTPNIPYACRTQERNPNRITELFPFYFWKFSAFYFPFFIRIYFRNFSGKDSGNLSGTFSRKSPENSAGIVSRKTDQTIPKSMTESVDDGTDRYVRHRHDGKSRRNFSTRSCTRMSTHVRISCAPHTKRKPRRSAEVFRKLLL